MPTTPFLKMFGTSPIPPLREHMQKVFACAQELEAFFQAVMKEDWAVAELSQQKISALEHDADKLKRNLRLNLPKSIFLPVSRTDLLDLLSVQDHIANRAKDIAGLVLGRKMYIPNNLHEQFSKYVGRSIAAVKQASKAIRELGDLFESGFSGNEIRVVEKMVGALDDIEHETDTIQIEIRHTLLAQEDQLPPVHVMFLYKIIEWVGLLADDAEKVGDRLQIFLAK